VAGIALSRATGEFARIDELMSLIRQSFAYMDGRIDPPSSAHRLTAEILREKCAAETAIVAVDGDKLVGCVFLAERPDHFYLGKLAVDPGCQGKGIGRLLMSEGEAIAKAAGKPLLELQTRIELTDNHVAFARMGFAETGRTAHEGFDRPTSITMRKTLS